MSMKKKLRTNYLPEFKIFVRMDMSKNHLSYRETVRKYRQTLSRTEEDLIMGL